MGGFAIAKGLLAAYRQRAHNPPTCLLPLLQGDAVGSIAAHIPACTFWQATPNQATKPATKAGTYAFFRGINPSVCIIKISAVPCCPQNLQAAFLLPEEGGQGLSKPLGGQSDALHPFPMPFHTKALPKRPPGPHWGCPGRGCSQQGLSWRCHWTPRWASQNPGGWWGAP